MLFSEISRDDRDLLMLVSHDESMVCPPPADPIATGKAVDPNQPVKNSASLN